MTQSIQIKNQNFVLHRTGAIFWNEESLLLISDVHLGKVSHFRKFGAAVPQNAISRNFELLDEAIDFFQPEKICFLGDLFHSSLNKEWNLFEEWVATVISKIVLVAGNHDIISEVKYRNLGIDVVTEIQLGGFLLTHHPEEREAFFNFSGHVHPAIRLRGKGRQSLRLPCFFKRANQLILPAFGKFTGSYVLEPSEEDEIFVLAQNSVLPITVEKIGIQ